MISEWHRTQARLALVVLIGAGPLVIDRGVWASNESPVLEYSVSGSGPGADEFLHAIEKRGVQRLLLDVAAAPRSRAFMDAALTDTGISTDQLEALGLFRLRDGQYQLSFSLLTLEDRQKIQAAAETEGRRLASILREQRSMVERLVRNGSMPTADWRATAFFILGCVSLDWDGLNYLEEKGYLAVPQEGTYLPTAYQPLPREALRQLYWGSHNYHDREAVTTFGDHYSLPRTGLPDVLWQLSVNAPQRVKAGVESAAKDLIRRHAAAVMLALRDGPQGVAALSSAVGSEQADVKDTLGVLMALEYVTESNGLYTAVIPVLTERDRPMVAQLREVGRRAQARWLEDRYEPLATALGSLTPRRYGVPLSNSFYWVWHPIFAIANRELVAAGLFADPYDPKRSFQGFVAAVYRLDVAQGPF